MKKPSSKSVKIGNKVDGSATKTRIAGRWKNTNSDPDKQVSLSFQNIETKKQLKELVVIADRSAGWLMEQAFLAQQEKGWADVPSVYVMLKDIKNVSELKDIQD